MNDATNVILMQILEQLRVGAEGSPSSVEIKSTAHGPDVTVKAYVGSPVREAGDAAIAEWRRVHVCLEHDGMKGWEETLKQVQAKQS